MAHLQSIQAEYLFEFTSRQHWINKGQSWFAPYVSKKERTICLDSRGNCLTTGEDFKDAETINTYPVKVYRLVRVSENLQNIVDELFS